MNAINPDEHDEVCYTSSKGFPFDLADGMAICLDLDIKTTCQRQQRNSVPSPFVVYDRRHLARFSMRYSYQKYLVMIPLTPGFP